MNISQETIIDNAIEFLDCDNAEINQVGDTYFLFLCYNRRSENEWYESRNNESYRPVSFDYIERQVVASGQTLEELNESMKFYIKLTKAPNGIEGMLLYMERDGVTKKRLDEIREAMIGWIL